MRPISKHLMDVSCKDFSLWIDHSYKHFIHFQIFKMITELQKSNITLSNNFIAAVLHFVDFYIKFWTSVYFLSLYSEINIVFILYWIINIQFQLRKLKFILNDILAYLDRYFLNFYRFLLEILGFSYPTIIISKLTFFIQ